MNVAPPFHISESKAARERRREEIRATLWHVLGDLPPRPKLPAVETLSRQDRDGYTLERFQFDNGAGAIVPGTLLIPARDQEFLAALGAADAGEAVLEIAGRPIPKAHIIGECG
jgi:hypothetical protein